MGAGRFWVGVDVGGTFTDIVSVVGDGGGLHLRKVPTTLEDVSRGILEGLAAAGLDLSRAAEIAHGTTAATNALLERRLGRAGLVTTEGFRDVLELRDGSRRGLFERQAAFEPVIPRPLRQGVPERIGPDGEVLEALDRAAVEAAGRALSAAAVEAVAVSFLHADRNPAHEEAAAAVLRAIWPAAHVVAASSLTRFPGEFLRTSTAAVAASLLPLLSRYIRSLSDGLGRHGPGGVFRFVESAGGSVLSQDVAQNPLRTVLSGPAGGAAAACALAQLLEIDRAVTSDMGGTSLDAAAIVSGRVELTGEMQLDFGIPLSLPAVDLRSAALGGGSVAWMDEAGLLRIGPRSAGAYPGPACFGRGGFNPTLTDADLLLGRLVSGHPDLGLTPLDAGAAERAFMRELCGALNAEPGGAAAAVVQVAEAKMVAFLQALLGAKGIRPGEATLIAFGGAGPLHAAAAARRLGIGRVVIPYLASGLSALGCLLTGRGPSGQMPVGRPLLSVTAGELRRLVPRGEASGGRQAVFLGLRRDPNPHEELLPWADGEEPEKVLERFRDLLALRYGVRPAPGQVVVSRILWVAGPGDPAFSLRDVLEGAIARGRAAARTAPSDLGTQGVRFDGEAVAVPIVRIESLAPGEERRGPALVSVPGGSAVVSPRDRFAADRWGNLLIEVR